MPISGLARSPSPLLWGSAAALAVALHAGALAAMLLQAPPEEDGSDLGAAAIEIGIELAAPRQEPSNLPPGPESDSSAASTASIQQRVAPEEARPEEQDIPMAAEEPDRVVAPQPAETPKEEQPVAQQQTEASSESVAAEATAAPAVETPREAPVAKAPAPGSGSSALRVRTTWQRQLVAHLDRNKRYPPGGARRTAEILVSFTLDRTGRIVSASLLRSSGDPAFDDAALTMVRRADPVPAPPPLVADEGLTFTVPVVFRAKGRG
ncbi:energy transducer TonB [uncultured Enterovirga sp.]|uniref:energy transducer TonB family protein n=1 Tax=uncultured Enterovirga sp. TaxID=2026352 RepID=UPI0035CC3174